jgi:hypothetical protein
MSLGKIQLQIVAKLVEMGRLDGEQRNALVARQDDLNGDALDKLLQDEFKVSAFQCLVAKARALNLSPFNVSRYRVTPKPSSGFRRIFVRRISCCRWARWATCCSWRLRIRSRSPCRRRLRK